jgi:dTDP-glucose 4,6-dehydratase
MTSERMPGSSGRPLPERDLTHILEHTQGLWEELRGGRLFVTGGTGFFGRWMLESFLQVNDQLGLGAEAIVLTRDPQAFADNAPHVVRHRAVALQAGDVRSFEYPNSDCTHVLHMATETALGSSAMASFRTAVEGTERVLAFATGRGVSKLLLTSSGVVYGPQPPDLDRMSEDYQGAPRPEDPSAGYGHGKRAAEFLCAAAASETELKTKIARCFAFVGPLLPLDGDFAIGNFIRDALYRDRIEVAGDGRPRRSYLYAADLAVWLWTILFRGESGRPYNVGSEADVSISDLARLVAEVLRPGLPVHTAEPMSAETPPPRYVPATTRAARELGVQSNVVLDDAVLRTAHWYLAGPTRRLRAYSRRGSA